MIIKNNNSKYHLNLQSPIVVNLNMFLDELNKLAIEEAMNHADESWDIISDEEFDEIFDENSPDIDLIQLENEILMKEGYGIYMVIDPDSELIYASSIGVGADNEEIRLIIFNKRLTSDGENIELINELNT